MKRFILPIIITFFCALGLFYRIGLHGYEFLAYSLWGIGAVIGIYWLCFRKKLKWLRWILTGVLALGLVAATITGIKIGIASQGDPAEDCPYLLVLGAGLNGTDPSPSLKSRLDTACDYLLAHPDVIAVVTGGQNGDEVIPESEAMANYLINKGIDPDRIWQENKSTSTRENFLFSLDLIREKTGQTPTELNVVSNEFHLYRVGKIAESMELTVHGLPAKTPQFFLRVSCTLREICAVWYYQLRWSIG